MPAICKMPNGHPFLVRFRLKMAGGAETNLYLYTVNNNPLVAIYKHIQPAGRWRIYQDP